MLWKLGWLQMIKWRFFRTKPTLRLLDSIPIVSQNLIIFCSLWRVHKPMELNGFLVSPLAEEEHSDNPLALENPLGVTTVERAEADNQG